MFAVPDFSGAAFFKVWEMRVLAIDQGTTSTRGFILDHTGAGTIIFSREHRQIYSKPGWVEHDPEELIRNIKACLVNADQIDAIGIDNQGESCLAWNGATGEAITPVIVWQDRRTENRVSALKKTGAEATTLLRAGLPLDPYFSASKLGWIVENIPEAKTLLAQGNLRLGTTDAFFNDRLTGQFSTDISTASRTSLLNIETGNWDQELCELFAIPIEALPEIRPTIGDFGSIKTGGREVPLVVSVVDQQAALFGHGCHSSGDLKITFGTGAFVIANCGREIVRAPEEALLPTIVWQETGKTPVYGLDGGVYCASSALNWAKSLGLFSDFSQINKFENETAISRKLVFVPALTGLGCPYWDGSAAGLWIGMSLETSPQDLVQAILEGVAFRAVQIIAAMEKRISVGDVISIDGGMSVNPYFCQFLADVLQKQVSVPACSEITAYGTALMVMGKTGFENNLLSPTIYFPENQHDNGKSLFEDALSRCRNWN